MAVNHLDKNELTPTQRQWVGRRGETVSVRTAGGVVKNMDVPKPVQRFKQFCYALDKGLITYLGPAQAKAVGKGQGDGSAPERPAQRASRSDWETYATHVGVTDPTSYAAKADLIAAIDRVEDDQAADDGDGAVDDQDEGGGD